MEDRDQASSKVLLNQDGILMPLILEAFAEDGCFAIFGIIRLTYKNLGVASSVQAAQLLIQAGKAWFRG